MKLRKSFGFFCYIALISALVFSYHTEASVKELPFFTEDTSSSSVAHYTLSSNTDTSDNTNISNNTDISNNINTIDSNSSELISDYTQAFPNLYAWEETSITTSAPDEKKTVYLTFDDGPSKNTGKILDILEQYKVKATFFVIGKDLSEEGIQHMQRAAAEGHAIGLHTYSHDYHKIYASVQDFLSDYDTLRQELEELLGFSPTIFRFPGGSYCSYGSDIRTELIAEMSRRGYTYYDWNVSAEDAVGNVTAYSIRKNIFPKVYKVSSPVILMHDAPLNNLTAELLPEIIETLQSEGYSFETLINREPLHFGE